MAEYTSRDAASDLEMLQGLESGDVAVVRLAAYIEGLESRIQLAERVCRAAVEVTTPVTKGEPFQQRQTRFLKALAEWRDRQE